jgi:hypothetical protein
MEKLWSIGLVVLGMIVIFSGFVYDVVYAGIPYQDPTPAMLASYNFHSQVASVIRWGGLSISAIGGGVMIFRRLSK